MSEKFAAIVAVARRATGYSAAEFDYSLVTGYAEHDTESALGAIDGAIYTVANEHLPMVDTTTTREDLLQRRANAEALRVQLQPEIDAMVAAAKGKSYTGWSNASRGPIRYAN
jgi:hypothetical protein